MLNQDSSVTLNDIQGVKLRDIADKFGTPLFVYDAQVLTSSYQQLKSFCGEHVDIFYSLKANPNRSIVSLLASEGAATEVCSSAELENVLAIGIPAEKIIFVGPYKSDEDIRKCLNHNIYAIVFESFLELERIDKIAHTLNQRAKVVARINPGFNSKDALLKMGGKPSQFGIDKEIFDANIKAYLNKANIELLGIHIYNGTRILNVDTIIENTKNILDIADNIQSELKLKFSCVDIGGGIGIPYFDNENRINLADNENLFQRVINEYLVKYPNTRIILESGRYLVAESGSLVSKIQDIKDSKGQTFLVTDGGTNCHMAAVGIGSFVKRNFPVSKVELSNEGQDHEEYNITGPLCTPNDLVAKKVQLPKCQVGELICIRSSGAYGPTASPVYFLSHGFPAEVMVLDKSVYLIRKRDSISDINGKQINIF